jgi:hypothetical protein
MPQKRALRHTGSYLKRQVESARKANPKLPVGLITTKPANISIRDSRGAQFMQEHFVREDVKSI